MELLASKSTDDSVVAFENHRHLFFRFRIALRLRERVKSHPAIGEAITQKVSDGLSVPEVSLPYVAQFRHLHYCTQHAPSGACASHGAVEAVVGR